MRTLILLCATFCLSVFPAWAQFTASIKVSGLTTPTSFAFLGPQDLLVLEKRTGKVQHIRNGTRVGPAIDLAVNYFGDRGALGIVPHWNFSQNKFVYIFWTWKGSGTGMGGLEGSDSNVLAAVPPGGGNRVDRFVWTGSALRFNRNIAILPSRSHVNTNGATTSGHTGGVLTFGPDRKLYVLAGDQYQRGRLQNIVSGPAPDNQNLTGVILRLNDDGTVPGNNPFFTYGQSLGGEVGRNIQKLFAYGVRNSFGMAFDPLGGGLWMQENGDDCCDEINRVPPGFNSRWIQVMGPNSLYSFYRNTEIASPDKLDNPVFPPEQLAPTVQQALTRLYALPNANPRQPDLTWKFSQGLAGLGFQTSTVLGKELYGNLFVGDALSGTLYRLKLNATRKELAFSDPRLTDRVVHNRFRGDLQESESLIFMSGLGVITDIETGPNGRLFVLSYSQGNLYEISRP